MRLRLAKEVRLFFPLSEGRQVAFFFWRLSQTSWDEISQCKRLRKDLCAHTLNDALQCFTKLLARDHWHAPRTEGQAEVCRQCPDDFFDWVCEFILRRRTSIDNELAEMINRLGCVGFVLEGLASVPRAAPQLRNMYFVLTPRGPHADPATERQVLKNDLAQENC